jgi:ABC-2 type transport system permease protein
MMLLYKTWRESKARFLFSAMSLAAFCLIIVLFQNQIRTHRDFMPWTQRDSYSQLIYLFVYNTGNSIFLVIMVPFLGLGGLAHERTRGTAGFTLSLPVERSRVFGAHVIVGLLELAVLALLPAVLVPTLSRLVHQDYPVSQALHFTVLWLICGAVMFAGSFFFSTILRGEYSAIVASIIALVVGDFLTSPMLTNYLYRWKILWIVHEFGTMHWDQQRQQLLSGPLPWVSLVPFILFTLMLLSVAFRISQKQDL